MTAQLLAPDRQDHLRPVTDAPESDASFEAVYRDHYDRLRRFVLGLTGQTTLAEDVAQETLLRVYTRRHDFDFDRPLWPWLKCVAVRLVVDNSRSQKHEALDPDPVTESPTDSFDVTVERQLLSDALRSLPVRQRVALGLRYLENWKSAEVAAVLGMSRVSVEQLLLRGRRRLSAEYLALGGDANAGLRVIVWPVLLVLIRVRTRAAARLRQFFSTGAGAQLPLTVEGATQVVAAAAIGGVLFAGGVALAAPAPHREVLPARAAAASEVDADHVLASTDGYRAFHAVRHSSVARVPASAAGATERAGSASAETPAAPPSRVTEMQVVAPAPVKDAPAASAVGAKKERTETGLHIRADVHARAGDAPGVGESDTSVDCSSGRTFHTACAAVDAVDAAVPASPGA